MPNAYDTLYNWARKTTSSFAELRFVVSQREHPGLSSDGFVYKLKHWPELPTGSRTAGVFQTLSVMSSRPVNRLWILKHARLHVQQVDQLLARLVREDAVEVIDTSNYEAHGHRATDARPAQPTPAPADSCPGSRA